MASRDPVYGIQVVSVPEKGTQPEVDIVAVHGLGGRAIGSWTAEKSKRCWLSDPEFLPKYVPNARVLVWGYNASFSSLIGEQPSSDRIHHHAQTLVANLGAERRRSGMANKPIIFLCHSLGGIIVKRALCYSQKRTAPKVAHDYDIFACTYGLLFFGTPHHGSSPAIWANYLKTVGSATTPSALGGMKKSDLLSALMTGSETLQNITEDFVPLMRRFCIFFLWEQEPTRLLLGARDYVVVQDSAAPVHDDTERAGIAADHRRMVKFEDPDAPGFQMVVEALVRYCADAPAATRQRRASAAHALEAERFQAVADALGSQGRFSLPQRVESGGLSSFTMVDRSNTLRSIRGREE